MQLLLHLRLYVGFGLIVGGGSLRKMPNWPFKPRSTFLRYSRSTPGFVANSERSWSEKTCCFETLYGRHPCGLADESGYLCQPWLDGGEDLDTGGSASVREVYHSERSKAYPFPMRPTCLPVRLTLSSNSRCGEEYPCTCPGQVWLATANCSELQRHWPRHRSGRRFPGCLCKSFDGDMYPPFWWFPVGADDLVLDLTYLWRAYFRRSH